jgi:hypothetical protein
MKVHTKAREARISGELLKKASAPRGWMVFTKWKKPRMKPISSMAPAAAGWPAGE